MILSCCSRTVRHAAAVALVGWYLLVPPYKADKHSLDVDASLPKWENFGSYDKAKECTDDRASQINFWYDEGKNSQYAARTLELLRHSVCMATDDPRLRAK